MKANLGSFAAALKDKDVWVMNAVPKDGPNTLKIVYDRGLIGTTHDWYVDNSYFTVTLKISPVSFQKSIFHLKTVPSILYKIGLVRFS